MKFQSQIHSQRITSVIRKVACYRFGSFNARSYHKDLTLIVIAFKLSRKLVYWCCISEARFHCSGGNYRGLLRRCRG